MVSPLVGRRRSPPAWMRDLDTFDRGAPHVRTSALRDWRPTSWCLPVWSTVSCPASTPPSPRPCMRPSDRSSGARLGHRSYSTLYVACFGNRQRAVVDGAPADTRFDNQVAEVVKARDDGLIAGVGLSNITVDHLLRALEVTEIACVQNLFNLADLSSLPVLQECTARGIAFVPFSSLGSGMRQSNPVLGDPRVRAIAIRLGATPAQVALAWALDLAPNLLVIPGTSSRRQPRREPGGSERCA